ncbi:MAG TPA: EamA family transporter [Trebonia sp.]|jgi:drug/metabolite transporter (DMT)-like permease|nr:EamA family transporter [Trebonia sp.]
MHAAALPLSVTLVVLAAAVTHATWNAIAHGIKDQLLAFGLIGAGGILVAIPLVIVSPFPLSACWPYLLASIVIHVFYNLLLMRSYRYGEFGQVYPLARGTSPLVVTVLAAVFAAERPSVAQVAGVLVVSCGLALLVLAGRRGRRAAAGGGSGSDAGGGSGGGAGRGIGLRRAALIAAVGTGLTIAAYTTVDGLGVRLSGSSVAYIGWLMLLESLCVPAWALARRRHELLSGTSRRVLGSGLLAGGLSVLAYGLVLWAQTRGDLAPISALRETSVIFGAVIGTVVFREPFGRWRIAATLLVVIGVLLLNVG